jgi:DNA invertase Pin-like site-specific DNA recombinase
MKTAVIYVRVSTEDQIKNTSLGSQQEGCERYSAGLGCKPIQVIHDDGETAKTSDREGLQRAIDLAIAKKVDALIVWKFDRLVRNTRDGLKIYDDLMAHGIELHSVSEGYNPGAHGKFMTTLAFALAELDNTERAKRCKIGMVEQAKRGGWVSKAPVGFLNVPKSNPPALEPDPETAPPIQQALRRFAAGATDMSGCLFELRAAGLSKSAASQVLRRPVYGGLLRSDLLDGQTIRACFDGLITPTEWYRLEARVREAEQPRRRHAIGNDDFLLASITRCAVCSRPLLGSYSRGHKGTRYGYYACRAGHVRVRSGRLHQQLEDMFRQAEDLKAILDEAVRKASAISAQHLKAVADARHGAQRRVREAEAKEAKLTDGWLSGVVLSDVYQAKVAELRAEQAKHRLTAISTDHAIQKGLESLNQLGQVLNRPEELFKRLDTNAKRRFLTLMFGSLVLGTDSHLSNPHNDGVCKLLPVVARGEISVGGPNGAIVELFLLAEQINALALVAA